MYDYETLAKLADEHGDAFYLLDVDRFRSNLRALLGAFRAIYPNTTIGYSYKTNYTPILCRIAHEEGCYAEVVSKMEYDLARRLGVEPSRILFNGPLKSAGEIEEALAAGAAVNVDSPGELDAVEALAGRHPGVSLRVGVRCNLSLEAGHASRFGISTDDLPRALERLRALPRSEIGLHFHSSSHRGSGAFRQRADRMLALARAHFVDAPPASIDVGGGFLGAMPEELRAQFGGEVPAYADYAEAVAVPFAAAYSGADTPELILEPGTGVVADTLAFVSRVGAVKRLAGGRSVAVTTGSIQNVKATRNSIRQPIHVAARPIGTEAAVGGPVDITGYTCMEGDVLYPDYPGALRVGDFVVLGNVGAYTTVFKPPFIRPAPAIVAHSGGEGTFHVVRRRERLDDLLSTYTLPT